MPTLTDEDIGIGPKSLSDSDIGIAPKQFTDSDIGIAPSEPATKTTAPLGMGAPISVNEFGEALGDVGNFITGQARQLGNAILNLPTTVDEKLGLIPPQKPLDVMENIVKGPKGVVGEAIKGGLKQLAASGAPGTGNLLLPEVQDVAQGAGNAVQTLGEGLTSPAMLGAVATGKAVPMAGRALLGYFAGDMAGKLPESIQHTATVVNDPKSTTVEKSEALAGLGLHALMVTGLAHEPLSEATGIIKDAVKPGPNFDLESKPLPDVEQAAAHSGITTHRANIELVAKADAIAPVAPKTAEALKEVAGENLKDTQEPLKNIVLGLPKPLSDFEQYSALESQLNAKTEEMKSATPETMGKIFNETGGIRAEMEAVKNRNGGYPPKAPEPVSEPSTPVEQTAAQVPDEPVQKYRVGNSPQTYSLVEELKQSPTEIENGEQPVKMKNDRTGEESVMLKQDLQAVNTRTAEEKAAAKLKVNLDERLKEMGMEPSTFKNSAQKRQAIRRAEAIGEGPGAQTEGLDKPAGSELKQLTQSINQSVPGDAPLETKIGIIDKVSDAAADLKDTALGALAKAKAVGDAVWDKFTKPAVYADEQRAVGDWTYANQKADFEARQFKKSIEKAVPDKLRREAMNNWLQAGGDETILQERADASRGSVKRGYEMAIKLTPEEQTLASNIGQYFDAQLQKGIDAGILSEGIENYVNQVWQRENPYTKKLKSDFQASKLQPNFRFAKQRIFDSYFEGEQAGYKPANKDIGSLVALYDQTFNKSLSARAFLKALHEGNASDGRPLVEISGLGKLVEGDTGSKIVIKPRSQADGTMDYRKIDHTAMRGWKWVVNDEAGNPVIMQGDLLVHPEAYAKLRNRLQSSAWRDNMVGKAILNTQSTIKQTMLSISGFHQAQETIHALGHRVNPLNLDNIDFDNPVQKELVKHGLQIADYHASAEFGEGLASGPLTNKIPWLGSKILKPYTEWLFQDYIPRLKVTMGKHALERNLERYKGDLSSGKITRDQVAEISANQANAAFGELNYKYMGRNPTLQDTMRAFLLAPDFLEARGRFVGQALKPYGKEQLVALGLLAMTQYITARIFNKVQDDDYHWEPSKAFSYIYNGREYKIRTVPGDITHLFADTRSFAYNRLSPLLGRGGIEAITGRDDRGVKRDALEQIQDLSKSAIPISMKKRDDVKLWESFLNAFGLQEKKYSAVTEISEKAKDFKKENVKARAFDEIYDADKDEYRPIRVALDNGSVEDAQKAYDKLKETIPASKIAQNLRNYYTKPFTGSRANESKFTQGLDRHGKATYQEAQKERQEKLRVFAKVKK